MISVALIVLIVILLVAARHVAQELRDQPGISARRTVPPRPARPDQGAGLVLADPVRRPRRQGRSAHHHLPAGNAGDDHSRRRRGPGQRGALVSCGLADPGRDLGRGLARRRRFRRPRRRCATRSARASSITCSRTGPSINKRLQELLREASIKWGVEIDSVEIKDVDIPEQMQRAIAKEAEAIREKRARIIKAEGEQEAAAQARRSGRNDQRLAGRPRAPAAADADRDRRRA